MIIFSAKLRAEIVPGINEKVERPFRNIATMQQQHVFS